MGKFTRKISREDLREYYGDPGQARFSNAKSISTALAGVLDQMPSKFVRSTVVDQLGLRTQREISLLTDALNQLKKRGLIKWDPDSSSWQNVTRS